jgi:DMSO/TMAO reductase YedYZ molybdopterin-dependent catalytic subunit
MNGEVLPREHGYPVRMLVPGRFGMKNAKWLIGLRLVRREVVDWYGQRKWSKDAVVKTMTRIEIPLPGATIPAGEYNIAGIAYAGDRGVRKVEFSSDDGMTWQEAKLIEPPLGRDTWVRWIGRFAIEAGASISLLSRATDGADVMQVEEFGLPQPNGSSGWHRLDVKARGA